MENLQGKGDFNYLIFSFMLIKEDKILVFIIHTAQFPFYIVQEMAIQLSSTTGFDFLCSEHWHVEEKFFVFVIFFPCSNEMHE